jgi:hypothetical protein
MATIVYNHRYFALQPYDIPMVNFLKARYNLKVVNDKELINVDFSDVDLLIIGATGDAMLPHSASDFISSLPVNIMSLAAQVSVNTLGLATATRNVTTTAFAYEYLMHPIINGELGTAFTSTNASHQIIENLTEGSLNIAYASSSSYRVIVERTDDVEGYTVRRLHFGYYRSDVFNETGWTIFSNALAYIIPPKQYTASGEYNFHLTDISGKKAINWKELVPDGTSVIVKYATGASNAVWYTAVNGATIQVSSNLWVKVLLATSDDSVTPVISDLKVSDAFDALRNSFLIRTKPLERFNNAVGPLTVSYDVTKGNLKGLGGGVQSFSGQFVPEDLTRKPNQHIEETIFISTTLDYSFIRINRHKLLNDSNIGIGIGNTVITFTNVGVVNP